MPPRPKTSRGLPIEANFAQTFRDGNAKKLQELTRNDGQENLLASEHAFRTGLKALVTDDESHATTLKFFDDAKSSLITAIEGLKAINGEVAQYADRTEVPQLGQTWQDDFNQVAAVVEAGRRFAEHRVKRVLRQDHDVVMSLTPNDRQQQLQALELLGINTSDMEVEDRKERDVLADAVRGIVRMTKRLPVEALEK